MLLPYRVGNFSVNLKKVFISIVRMIPFSRKLEILYIIYEKLFSPLVHMCLAVSLIFAYRRPVQVFPNVFYFSDSYISE